MSATCRGCGKPILWATTREGKKIPLDPKAPVYYVIGDGHDTPFAEKTTGGYFVSHFSTCPKANDFSGSKKSKEEVKP